MGRELASGALTDLDSDVTKTTVTDHKPTRITKQRPMQTTRPGAKHGQTEFRPMGALMAGIRQEQAPSVRYR